MRNLLLGLLVFAAMCPAATIIDIFHENQATCVFSGTPLCDVVGTEPTYDIEKADVSISGGTAKVTLFFNTIGLTGTGSGLALTSFVDDGVTLRVGDLFFYNPGDPTSLLYGVPLLSHDGFLAGNLYQITGNIGVETAQAALNNINAYYRNNEMVLMTYSGTGAPAPAAIGQPVTVTGSGDGISHASYAVTLQVPASGEFGDSVMANGVVGIQFSSAICGNDVIQGAATANPEPQTLLLLAGGLGMLCLWRRRAYFTVARRAPVEIPPSTSRVWPVR